MLLVLLLSRAFYAEKCIQNSRMHKLQKTRTLESLGIASKKKERASRKTRRKKQNAVTHTHRPLLIQHKKWRCWWLPNYKITDCVCGEQTHERIESTTSPISCLGGWVRACVSFFNWQSCLPLFATIIGVHH